MASPLEFGNRVVPEVVKEAEIAFYHEDALFNDIQRKNKIVRTGGEKVRFVHVISGHSTAVEINASNHTVAFEKEQTLTTADGDWGWISKPVTISKYDLGRLGKPDEKARHIKEITEAAMEGMKQDAQQRVWSAAAQFKSLSTLYGGSSDGTSSGFTRGPLEFDSPTQQNTNAYSYLNRTKVYTSDTAKNNWYNQHVDWTPGTNGLKSITDMKRRCDSYAKKGKADLLMTSFATAGTLEEEMMAYPAAAGPSLVYTVDDVAKGKVMPPMRMFGDGIRMYTNRWMAALDTLETDADPVYLLNSDTIEWWVNEGHDFKFNGLKDLEAVGTLAFGGLIHLEAQLCIRNLMCNGTASNH